MTSNESKELVKVLKSGGVAVMPTDTIFGIVGRADSKDVVKRIYKIKGRDKDKPLIVLISSIRDLKKFGVELKKEQLDFLKNVWLAEARLLQNSKRAVSVVLPTKSKEFAYLKGKTGISFRLPKNEMLINLIKKTGPLVAPSANPQGLPPAKNIKEAKEYFGNKVDIYIRGKVKSKKPSQLWDLTGKEPICLRK